MLIVGGTYLERTAEPATEMVFGSGLRAAAALAGVSRPRLTTCLDSLLLPAAEGVARAYGFEIATTARQGAIGFSYHTPLSRPTLQGADQPRLHLDVRDDAPALVFGMIEATCLIASPGIVYDPQGVEDARRMDRSRFVTERLAVVANIHEVTAAGRSRDVIAAARRIIAETAAALVVVKRGALGCLVVEAAGAVTPVGPHPTETVWPVGSGDVFSAAFAWAWLEDRREPVAAARLASASAALWCGTQVLPLPLAPAVDPASFALGPALIADEEAVPVYLAGPFFTLGQRWLVNLVRDALVSLGARVFSPLHDVGVGTRDVAGRDLAGLRASRSLLGLLDGADAGTLYEIGYAAAEGIPAVGLAADPLDDDFTMPRGSLLALTGDLSTAVYRAIWAGMRHP